MKRSIFFIVLIAIFLSSCYKESPQHLSEASLPNIITDQTRYSIDDLLGMADLFGAIMSLEHERQDSCITPTEVKFGLETLINRDFSAGRNIQGDMNSNISIFDLDLNEEGLCTPSKMAELYNSVVEIINSLSLEGKDFYILDVELAESQLLLVDVITGNYYTNEDFSFGFNLFNEGESYQIFQDEFENDVNNRLTFEYINPEDYFLTDIYPNPSLYPNGLTLSSVDILGTLSNGCIMYAGTLEEFGGPELVYGGQSNLQQLSGATANDFILRGVNYIIEPMPTDQGYQLIKLEFGILYNGNVNPAGDNCLPGDPCNTFYPCFTYSHYWKKGRFARKAVYEK